MNASDFLYEKYGIAVTEHNKLPVSIKPADLLKYMEEYAALRQPLVSGSLLCHHNFIQKDTYWKSCTHCGMLAPLGQ